MIERLINYYGRLGNEEQRFINENVMKLDDRQQNDFATALMSDCPSGKKAPDVAALNKALKSVAGTKARSYIWAVCNACGAEYDYKFMTCPKCFLAGKHSSGYKVRKSDFPPPIKVIRWNQTTLQDDGKVQYCVSCPIKENSYCRWFGEPEHTCAREEYEYCECKKCCAFHKRANEKVRK